MSQQTSRQPARRREMSVAEYALLGLIAQPGETGSGVHGYLLSQQFGDGAISRIIHLEPGMLYHYLKKLAKTGLVETRIEAQDRRPDRQVLHITEQGLSTLREWISAPVRATREIRLEFLVKLYLNQHDEQAERTLIERQRQVMADLVDSLHRQLERIAGDSNDDRFQRSVLNLRLSQTTAAVTWLDSLPNAH